MPLWEIFAFSNLGHYLFLQRKKLTIHHLTIHYYYYAGRITKCDI